MTTKPKAKHTPGPLEITYEVGNKTWGVCLPDGGDVLAQLIEKKEDAVLYAAAPDLLVALKDLQREVHAYRLLDVRKRFSLCTADAQAGTAIAKAEGRKP